MQIGSVIRKYRKECGLTQEEMAKRLGVTTPAVNKWENGNTNPDIELLAPIARLLHISLDTLLSFQEKLTDMEIETLIRQMGDKLEKEGFEKTYEWAVQITKKYPNCNMLIWQIAVMLDAGRITGACGTPEQYDEQINAQGLLTNRYLNGIPTDSRIATDGRFLKESALTPEKLAQIQALNVLAGERGQTLAEMALSWILKDDKVTSVLIGASKPEQILDNIKIIGHTDFTEEELQKIETIAQG